MDFLKIVSERFEENRSLCLETLNLFEREIYQISDEIADALSKSNAIFWCGNGGSCSDSNHLSTELVGKFKKARRPLNSISLSSETSLITCIANDFGYEEIFSRQLEGLGKRGDVLITISTSGNSKNVVNAIQIAKKMQIKTIGLLGMNGGAALNLVEIPIVIPSFSTDRIQEQHILIGHILCELIEVRLGL